jgi:protein involved in polysaccharide export with SLBB domain
VLSDPELSGEYEIDSAGMISPRMAGRVQVVGMTTAEIEELLRTRYRTDGLLRVARLSVDLVQRRPFYILGEVGRPGAFPYVSGINVAQAIAIAGGFTRRSAKTRITIQRFNQTQGMEETVTETVRWGRATSSVYRALVLIWGWVWRKRRRFWGGVWDRSQGPKQAARRPGRASFVGVVARMLVAGFGMVRF